MKFSGVVHPGDVVRLSLSADSPDAVSYTYVKGDRVCSSGVMVLKEGDSA